MGQGYGYSEQDVEIDIQNMINALDVMDEKVNERVTTSFREGAEIIVREQRRLISGRSSKLPELLKVGKFIVDKKGKLSVTCGYDTDAINKGFEGLIMEFGRPGKRSGGVYQKGKRKGKPIGKVTPTPHVFRAVDNKGDEAAYHVIDSVAEVIKW